jgi:hypothetical protein
MSDSDGEGGTGSPDAGEIAAVAAQLEELQHRKRDTVRWHMSRDTAERAIAAIRHDPRRAPCAGKSRRRKRHKRLL